MQAQIAQLVEQRTENPRVTGSIPVLGTIFHISICGCSSMVEHQPSKLDTWVRFPSPALLFCREASKIKASRIFSQSNRKYVQYDSYWIIKTVLNQWLLPVLLWIFSHSCNTPMWWQFRGGLQIFERSCYLLMENLTA